jgi:DNA-binding NtrC family response regulator
MASLVIVEDEALILMLTESILRKAGYKTMAASSVAEAKAIIDSTRKFDVVMTDISLGRDKDGGLKIGQHLHKMRPGTPVLYTSGLRLDDEKTKRLVDPSCYLPKPYAPKT